MPQDVFAQTFTANFDQIEQGLNRLSARGRAIAREALSGITLGPVSTGPSVAQQAGVITAAIRRAQQIGGGPVNNKQIEDSVRAAFGGNTFAGVTGDPAQGAKIGNLQQQITAKLNEEFQTINTAVDLRRRTNQLLTQSASSVVGRSAVSSANIGRLIRPEALDRSVIQAATRTALPAASDADIANLNKSRQRIVDATEQASKEALDQVKSAADNADLERVRANLNQRSVDAQRRALDNLLGGAGAGGTGGGGPAGGVFDPFGDDAQNNDRIREAIDSFNNSAKFNEAAATDPKFLASKERLRTSELNLSAAHTETEAGSRRFVASRVRLDVAQNNLTSALNEVRAGSDVHQQSLSRLAVSRNRLAESEAKALSTSEVLQSATERRVAELNKSNAQLAALNADPRVAAGVAEQRRLEGERKVNEAQAADANRARIAQQRVIVEQSRLRQEAQFLRLSNQELVTDRARVNSERAIFGERVKLEQLNLGLTAELNQVRAQRIAAEQKAARQFNRLVAQELRASGAGFTTVARARFGGFSGGRFEGGTNAGGGLGGFFGGGLLSTARFAIPSALLFGGGRAIVDVVDEAEEMERIFNQIEAQLEAVDQAGEFPNLKESVLEIARETGNLGRETAEFAFQLQGAFGTGVEIAGLSGQELVQAQLDSISQINRLTDIDNQQAVDSITAISNAFNVLGEDVGDAALVVQNVLGVELEDTINFLGDIAPVAEAAGFSMQEFAAIAGAAQRASGRSGTTLAESFGRIIPAIAGARGQLLELASANETLGTPEFIQALADQDIRGQLLGIIDTFEQLDEVAQNQLIELLGGRREAQVLLTVVQNRESFDRALAALEDGEGELERRFEIFQETLSQQLAQLAQQFRELGVEIFESGIDEVLIGALDLLSDMVEAVQLLLGAWNGFNDALDGTPGDILKISLALAAVYAIIQKIGGFSVAASGIQSLFPFLSGLAGAGAGTAAATTTATAASGLLGPTGAPIAASAASGIAVSGTATATATSAGAAIGAALSTAAAAAIAVGAGAAIGTAIGRSGSILGFDLPGPSQNDLEAQRENLKEQFAQLSDEQLRRLGEDTRGFWQTTFDGLASTFTGVDTDIGSIIDEVLAERLGDRIGTGAENFLALSEQGVSDEGIQEVVRAGLDQLELPVRRDALLQQINDQFDISSAEAVNEFFGRGIIDPEFRNLDPSGSLDRFGGANIFEGLGLDLDALRNSLEENELNELIEKAIEANNTEALLFLSLISDSFGDQEVIDQALAEAEEIRIAALDEVGQAEARIDQTQQTVDQAKAAFEAGTGSLQNYLDALDKNINAYREAFALTGNQDEELLALINEAYQERGKAFSDFAQEQDELFTEISNLVGGDDITNIQTEIDTLLDRLNDPQFTDPEGRQDYAFQLIELQQAFYDASIRNAETAEEALAIAEAGVPVLPEVRAELLAAQIRATAENDFATLFEDSILTLFDAGRTATFQTVDDFVGAVSIALVAGGETAAEMRDLLEAKIAELGENYRFALRAGQGDAADAFLADLNALRDAFEAIDTGDPTELGENIVDPTSIRDQQQIDRAREQAEREAQRAAEEAAREAERAAAERARAAEEARKQQEDLARARLEYALALVSGNPVEAARIQIQQADLAFRQAETEAERLRAQAQKIQAERQLVEAIRDIGDAQVELLLAQANFAGDTIEASQISLRQAQERLAQLQRDFQTGNAGEADVIRGQAEVIRAQAAARDAQLSSSLDDYQFLYDMEQINKQQFIAYLQSLKQIPDLTTDQIRSIDRQIKGLSDELRGDLQFNLPTNLNLPTLYEVRRTNQLGSGIGYQDNRVNTITIYVTDGVSLQQAQDLIDDNFGNGRTGTRVRSY